MPDFADRGATDMVADSPLPARIGRLLAGPTRGLRAIDARGGGLRDVFWLVVVGALCFRLEDLMRGLLGITHLSGMTVVRQTLAVFSQELLEAITVVVPAGLGVTVLAGRGHRDPSLDLDLGGACYVPFFAVRSVMRTLDLDAFFGPLPRPTMQIFNALSLLGASLMFLAAVRVARARVPGHRVSATAKVAPLLTQDRVATTALAAVFGGALFVNAGWVARNAAAIAPLGSGSQAPNFSLPRLDAPGGRMGLSDFKGKVVLLDFWATWCPPCVQMIPTLHEVHARWQAQGVEILGINSDGPGATTDDVRAFLATRPPSYPIVMDNGEVGGLYKVVALPHMVLVGRDGAVAKVMWGVTSKAELDDAIGAAVGR